MANFDKGQHMHGWVSGFPWFQDSHWSPGCLIFPSLSDHYSFLSSAVNSKAEVRFHLATADWIAEPVRQKIALKHKNKINREGELILTSESSRYQFRNLADCLQKIRDMIAEASQMPKEPSKEDAQLQRIRIENMNRERLRQKRINSAIKTSRRVDMD
ncbi:Hypothetical predicted protein [Marmota monax]|uniref:Prokaryotic-type class I peptide chain release factors domain-containing protein n=1 Tax=Marmota monax TaxID=9995 RepID=A0A5E4ARD7_MARMO|nr:Hypothetical predicted protein [Marmota monax]